MKLEYDSKSDSSKIQIKVKGYNNSIQNFAENDDINLKGETLIMSQLIYNELQERVKEVKKGEVEFLKKYLEKSLEDGGLVNQCR